MTRAIAKRFAETRRLARLSRCRSASTIYGCDGCSESRKEGLSGLAVNATGASTGSRSVVVGDEVKHGVGVVEGVCVCVCVRIDARMWAGGVGGNALGWGTRHTHALLGGRAWRAAEALGRSVTRARQREPVLRRSGGDARRVATARWRPPDTWPRGAGAATRSFPRQHTSQGDPMAALARHHERPRVSDKSGPGSRRGRPNDSRQWATARFGPRQLDLPVHPCCCVGGRHVAAEKLCCVRPC